MEVNYLYDREFCVKGWDEAIITVRVEKWGEGVRARRILTSCVEMDGSPLEGKLLEVKTDAAAIEIAVVTYIRLLGVAFQHFRKLIEEKPEDFRGAEDWPDQIEQEYRFLEKVRGGLLL